METHHDNSDTSRQADPELTEHELTEHELTEHELTGHDRAALELTEPGLLSRLNLKQKQLRFRLSRACLHAWIKPTILGGNHEALDLEPEDLVCYVLPFRSLADLLVVDKACERGELPSPTDPIAHVNEHRSIFFLGHPEGTFGRKTLRQQSLRMTRLFSHQDELSGRNIKIVPVSAFWGHQPDREKSLFKLILSEHWTATSGMKKFLAGLFHPRHILVQFGKPISLAELTREEPDRERQIRKLLRLLRVHFNSQRQAIIGPDLSHRRTLLNTILSCDTVMEAIEREARSRNVPVQQVEKKALKYAKEIASDQSYRVIRFFDVLLTWLWNNLYGGIEVNGIDVVKQAAQSNEIVYIPCHRSHIDYLLLSYVLYHNGLTPPHIAAGRNLNLPVIGGLLRRAGAFYMRRSFQGDPLYKEVFDEYLHQMFTKGYSIEYFIEGGRSRTGRTLAPRTGMLRMTVNSFQKDATKPIAFMPVYFGYERVLESSTYMAELSGKPKETESIFDVFGIFSSLKRDFGRVTVNFGEPLMMQEFLDSHLVGWREPDSLPQSVFNEACLKLANELATRINASVAIKPVNLVALALLSTTRQNIEEQRLLNQIELLRNIALQCSPAGSSITDQSPEEMLTQAIDIVGLERREHKFGTIISASWEQTINLTYNGNNVLHVFAIPSLIARYLRTTTRCTATALHEYIEGLFPYIKAEMFLSWRAGQLPELINNTLEVLQSLDLVNREGEILTTSAPSSPEFNCLQDIARITDPTLERFHIVTALLTSKHHLSQRELETAASGIAEQLSVLYGISSPDFFDRPLFTTFVSAIKQQAIVDRDLVALEPFKALEARISRTIDPDIRYNVMQAVSNYAPNNS